MSNEHTPGPWVWSGNDLDGDTDGLESVMEPRVDGGSIYLGITPANARLIAAAPDLLEAAIEALQQLDCDNPNCKAVDLLEVAIRAALHQGEG